MIDWHELAAALLVELGIGDHRGNEVLSVTSIAVADAPLTHRATTSEGDAAIIIADPHQPLTDHQLVAARDHATWATLTIGIAYQFDPTATPDRCWRVAPHRDLAIQDLGYEPGARSFTLTIDIAVAVHDHPYGGVEIEVRGVDAADVHSWLLDPDHDGECFTTRRVHLINGQRADSDVARFTKDLKLKRKHPATRRRIDSLRSLRSAPIDRPASGLIGVRVVLLDGQEVTRYVEVAQ